MRTLLVFAKAPVPGRVKTRLTPALGTRGAADLYRALAADLADRVRALQGIRVEWWVDGPPDGLVPWGARVRAQAPGDLGERLRTAFGAAFARGGTPVAVVGTDVPLLAASHLEALFAALAGPGSADAAVIPAEDGGYAALGLTRPADPAFRAIPWSTPEVLQRTLAALRGLGRTVRVLPPLYDVDEPADLPRLARDLRREPSLAPHTTAALAALGVGAP